MRDFEHWIGHHLSEHLYRKALVLFPREFRRRYADSMVQVFRDTSREARNRRGVLAVLVVRARMFVELLIRAPGEWFQIWSDGRRNRLLPSKHKVGEGRGVLFSGSLIQDLRYAIRRLAKNPGFLTVAVCTLAIGIGANTAIFSLVNAILIRGRPYEAAHELVHVYSHFEGRSFYANSSYLDLSDLQSLDDVFVEVGAYAGRMARVFENDESRPAFVEAVTHNLFPLLGIRATLGRTFLPEEDVVPGNHPVAMLGFTYWQRRFGGDPGAIGQTISLGGRPYTIVGVTPESLESLMIPGVRTDLFVPMKMAVAVSGGGEEEMFFDRGAMDVKIIGRLKPDVDIDIARSRVELLSNQLRSTYAEAFEDRSFHLVRTVDVVIQPDFDAALLVPVAALLMTMVALVLLLTCTNLAGLLLAQGMDRGKEFAVRLALGASRGRLVLQLLCEFMLLGLLGCALGLLVARWMLDILTSIQPPFWVPITINYGLDRNVLLFTLCVTVLAGLLAGLAPAIRSTKRDVAPALRGKSVSDPSTKLNLRNGLVAVQIAVATVLLVGGGLFLRSLQMAAQTNPGFSTSDAGVVWLDLGVSGKPESDWDTLTDELTERVRSLPGIDFVGASTGIPLAAGAWSGLFQIPGVVPPDGEESLRVRIYSIDQGFFETMGISLASGRGIQSTDRGGTEPVVLVSQAAAERFWPGDDPLGKVITQSESGVETRVVGVVQDIKIDRLDEAPQALFYFPRKQYARRSDNLLLVARGPALPAEIAADMRQVIRDLDSDLVFLTVSTLREQFSTMLFPFRAAAGLLAAFGCLALFLAAIGLYGIVSFTVSRRTNELGIRMSLGATAESVTRLLVRGVLGVVFVGIVVGMAAAFGIARFLQNFLIGVGTTDLLTLASVPLLLGFVAFLAAVVPARRATKVCPVNALRSE